MNRPEEDLQKSVVAFLKRALPPTIPFFAVPNQRGTRKRYEMAILKAMGVKPGVADLVFVLPGGKAAFLELKAPGGKPTDSQTTFGDIVQALGAPWAVARSLPEVEGILTAWLAGTGVSLRARLT